MTRGQRRPVSSAQLTVAAEAMLRTYLNGRFREYGIAAMAEGDRRLRAGRDGRVHAAIANAPNINVVDLGLAAPPHGRFEPMSNDAVLGMNVSYR